MATFEHGFCILIPIQTIKKAACTLKNKVQAAFCVSANNINARPTAHRTAAWPATPE